MIQTQFGLWRLRAWAARILYHQVVARLEPGYLVMDECHHLDHGERVDLRL